MHGLQQSHRENDSASVLLSPPLHRSKVKALLNRLEIHLSTTSNLLAKGHLTHQGIRIPSQSLTRRIEKSAQRLLCFAAAATAVRTHLGTALGDDFLRQTLAAQEEGARGGGGGVAGDDYLEDGGRIDHAEVGVGSARGDDLREEDGCVGCGR